MNPLHNFFLALAKLPPVLKLVIILGMALCMTTITMNRLQEINEKARAAKLQINTTDVKQ